MNKLLVIKVLITLLCFSVLFNITLLRFKADNMNLSMGNCDNVNDFEIIHPEQVLFATPPPSPSSSSEVASNSTIIPSINSTSTNNSTSRERRKRLKTYQGNIANDEIFKQSVKRKRRPAADKSMMVDIPTFSSPRIIEDSNVLIALNNRLISTSKTYDIIVLIPSLARINATGFHSNYLIRVLEEYERQLKEAPTEKTILFIIHAFINEKTHKIFKHASQMFMHVVEFVFFVPPFRFRDPFSDIPRVNYSSPTNVYPGKMARQQTCDVLSMTKFVNDNFKFNYIMYTEDDFLPCEGMLNNTFKYLERIEQYHHHQKQYSFEKGFCALRITSGLGGLIVSKNYIELFMEFAKNNIDLSPVDILIHFVSFSKGDGYKTCLETGLTHYSLSTSSLEHIGHESNWKERNDKKIFGGRDIKCKDNLGGHDWHLGAMFGEKDSRKCKDNDIKPCVSYHSELKPTNSSNIIEEVNVWNSSVTVGNKTS